MIDWEYEEASIYHRSAELWEASDHLDMQIPSQEDVFLLNKRLAVCLTRY